jgi:hypothetical protein
MNKYKSDMRGELIPTVIVQFDSNFPDLWMTKEEYDANGKFKGLLKSGFPLRNIIKVHCVLKNPSKYPTTDWP